MLGGGDSVPQPVLSCMSNLYSRCIIILLSGTLLLDGRRPSSRCFSRLTEGRPRPTTLLRAQASPPDFFLPQRLLRMRRTCRTWRLSRKCVQKDCPGRLGSSSPPILVRSKVQRFIRSALQGALSTHNPHTQSDSHTTKHTCTIIQKSQSSSSTENKAVHNSRTL